MSKKIDSAGMDRSELAAQLRQPTGDVGREVGRQMNNGNIQISMNAYSLLEPTHGQRLLELGMGNGLFIRELLKAAPELHLTGVDYATVMVEESRLNNAAFIQSGQAHFVEASIAELPFSDVCFDGIVTTNTLYFWPEPLANAKELLRVLKPGGRLVIAYRDRSCLDQLELASHGFERYDSKECEALLQQAGFTSIQTRVIPEDDLEFDGSKVSMAGFYTLGHKL